MSGFRGLLAVALIAVLAGCDNSNTVAKAAGHELTVDEAVGLLVFQPQLPNDREVGEALANIWVDFILLANVAMADSTFESVDFSAIVDPEVEQELVYRLQQEVIQVDTIIEDDELRALYDERAPGAEVRARHILLNFPEDATTAQRDSVMTLAGELRERVVGGESFASLAEQYSADPGSAREGGDLGYFERQGMVEPFGDAAFALEPGQISEPVESMYGVHVIQVEDRRMPDFEDVRAEFLAQLRSERLSEAEVEFLENLEGSANVEIAEDAYAVVRDVAGNLASPPSGRAGRNELVSYEGGAYTTAKFYAFVQARGAGFAAQVEEAGDEDLEQMLRSLTRGELLVQDALGRGLDLSDEEKSEIREDVRLRYSAAAREAGLHQIAAEEGESQEAAIDRVIMERLKAMVEGQGEGIPLGPLGTTLREAHGAEVNPRGVDRIVEKVAETRGPEDELPEFLQTPPSSDP